MKIVNVCGYDGKICEKYRVKLDGEGNVKEEEIKCDLNMCERCHFMGKPWVRLEIKDD